MNPLLRQFGWIVLLFGGCAGPGAQMPPPSPPATTLAPPRVQVEISPDARFDSYQTFSFAQTKDAADTATRTELRRLIGDHLQRLGYRPSQDQDVDLTLAFRLVTETRSATSHEYHYYGAEEVSSAYRAGTLLVAAIDVQQHKTVWRGQADDTATDPIEGRMRIRQALADLFSRFPPRATDAQP